MKKLNVMVTFPLDDRDIEMIKAVSPDIEITYAVEEVIAENGIKGKSPYGKPMIGDMDPAEATARLNKMLVDTEVIFAWRLPKNLTSRAPKLKWVHSVAAGVDLVAGTSGLLQSDVTVTNSTGLAATAVAEWTLFLMIALAKNAPRVVAGQKAHKWDAFLPLELKDKTVCIIGTGNIGREVAKRARAFGMRVLGIDKMVTKHESNVGDIHESYPIADLHKVLPECDWLVLNLPLTSETRGMIGEKELKLMKPTAHLVNMARGPIVNEQAMIKALKEKRLAGAGLDVFEVEPLPANSELWDMPNVIASAHNAGLLEKHTESTTALFCDNLKRYIAGEKLIKVIDKSTVQL